MTLCTINLIICMYSYDYVVRTIITFDFVRLSTIIHDYVRFCTINYNYARLRTLVMCGYLVFTIKYQ